MKKGKLFKGFLAIVLPVFLLASQINGVYATEKANTEGASETEQKNAESLSREQEGIQIPKENDIPDNEEETIIQPENQGSFKAAGDGDTRDDWLHYSIDLKWKIADPAQKYNQKIINTNPGDYLYPTYMLTIQTSSVIYDPGKMEIRLPLTLFQKRVGEKNRYGEDFSYEETGPAILPNDIAVPKAPETSDSSPFNYYIDEENDELVFINYKELSAGTNSTIEVQYGVNPNVVVDLSKASIQAKAKATPRDEETGSYPEEEKVSNTITYQVDTGFYSCDEPSGDIPIFKQLQKIDGYRYYFVHWGTRVNGSQPFDADYSFDFLGTGGEIVGFEEQYLAREPMSEEEFISQTHRRSYGSQEGSISGEQWPDDGRDLDFYVRYPDSDEQQIEDKLKITLNAVGADEDDHLPPNDMNDMVSITRTFRNTWVNYPPKPIGIWLKGPHVDNGDSWQGQERNRAEFLFQECQLSTNAESNHFGYTGAAYFFIGVASDTTVDFNTPTGNIVITDTGLDPVGEAQDLEYEISSLNVPIVDYELGLVARYDEETQQIIDYNDNSWFESIRIEGTTDGNTWDVIYEGEGYEEYVRGYPSRRMPYWVGKGYKQARVTIIGVKDNTVFKTTDDDGTSLVDIWMHGTDYSSEYLKRQQLDQYINWMNLELVNNDETSVYTLDDFAYLTLFPFQSYGSSTLNKFVRKQTNDPVNHRVNITFSVSGGYLYCFKDLKWYSTSLNSEAQQIGRELKRMMDENPTLFEGEPILDDAENVVTYDLLPLGYRFDGFESSPSFLIAGYNYRSSYTTEVIDNYKGTGRQMVIVTQNAKAAFDSYKRYHTDELVANFKSEMVIKTSIGWEDLVFYQNEHNLVAQQISNKDKIYGASADDGKPTGAGLNLDVFHDVLDENSEAAFKDLNEDGKTNTKNTNFATAMVSPNIALSATTGITKQIKGDGGVWTDIDHTDINRRYQYRIRVSNGDETNVKDLIVYDTLEDAANTELHSGEVTWKGSFHSVDTSMLTQHGYAPVVYYSTADRSQLDYNIVTGREDEIWIDDESIWSTQIPDNPADVTAIAVDCRKMKDGNDAVLKQYQGIEFIINMTAPPEYPTLKNPDMVYAINRPAYHSYQYVTYPSEGTYYTDIGRRVKIYLEPRAKITVRKQFVNQQNNPTFTLTGPNGYTKTFNYSDMKNGELVIEDLNLGTYTIKESFYDYGNEYTMKLDGASNIQVTEDTLKEISGEIKLDWDEAEAIVTFTNTSKYKNLNGSKVWAEREDITNDRFLMEDEEQNYPSSRLPFVVIARNNDKVETTAIVNPNDSEWSINRLPAFDENGNEIEYTIEEQPILSWSYQYNENFNFDSDTLSLDLYTKKTNTLDYFDELELILMRMNYGSDQSILEEVDRKTVDASIFKEGDVELWKGLPFGMYWIFVGKDSFKYDISYDDTQITNTRLMKLEAKKEWDALEGVETPEATLYLEKTVNGKTSEVEGSEKVIPANATNEELTIIWEDLPEYEDGNPVTYKVAERESTAYELVSITGDDVSGFKIVNRILMDVNGVKNWKDNDNKEGTRPDSIVVKLLEDGKEVKKITVTEKDEWKFSFTNLPKYKDGKEIKYTIEEEAVKGYITNIEGDQEKGFSINNVIEDKPNPSPTPTPDAPKVPNKPNTADHTNVQLWNIIFLASVGMLCVLLKYRRKIN